MYIHKFTYVSIYIYIYSFSVQDGYLISSPQTLRIQSHLKFGCNHVDSGTKELQVFLLALCLHQVVIHYLHCQIQGLITHLKGCLKEQIRQEFAYFPNKQPSPDRSRNLDCLEHQGQPQPVCSLLGRWKLLQKGTDIYCCLTSLRTLQLSVIILQTDNKPYKLDSSCECLDSIYPLPP